MSDEVHFGSGNVLKDLDIVFTRAQWAEMCERTGSRLPYPYADIIPFPIIAGRREAAGKIGDEHAFQTQRPEVDASGLPSV